MLLRNIRKGLNNGTKLTVVQVHRYLLTLRRASPPYELIYLNRWRMSTSIHENTFTLQRKQFPIQLAFACTINKLQGHTLNKIGIYLDKCCFSHGQLYVALSRAIGSFAVMVMIVTTHLQGKNRTGNDYHTQNIVFRELFNL